MRHSASMLLCAVLCLGSRSAQGTVRPVLDVMVEDAASPWSRADGTGLANEVVVAAFAEAGITVRLHVVPYARCKHAVLRGSVVACVSMTWLPEFKGRVELASEPLIVLNVDVFENVHKPLPRPRDGHCRLPAGTRTGVVRKYEYPAEAASLAREGAVIDETDSDYQSLKMLAAGRLDAAIVMTNDLEPRDQKALESGVRGKVRWAFSCGRQTGTIGFSLGHPDGQAARAAYERGYQRIRAHGKLAEIAARWQNIVADVQR